MVPSPAPAPVSSTASVHGDQANGRSYGTNGSLLIALLELYDITNDIAESNDLADLHDKVVDEISVMIRNAHQEP